MSPHQRTAKDIEADFFFIVLGPATILACAWAAGWLTGVQGGFASLWLAWTTRHAESYGIVLALLAVAAFALEGRLWWMHGHLDEATGWWPSFGFGGGQSDTSVRRTWRGRRGLPGDRILLGLAGGRWVTAPPNVGALIVGPPRTGKSAGLVIPNVLAWQGSVVATSTRRELVERCAAHRQTMGTVWVFDPMGIFKGGLPPGCIRLAWSPVTGARDWHVALMHGDALTSGSGKGVTSGSHWEHRSAQLVSLLLHAAALGGHPMQAVGHWATVHDLETPRDILEGAKAEDALAVASSFSGTPPNEMGSIWSTAVGCLRAFGSPLLRDMEAGGERMSWRAFLAEPSTLFLVVPADAHVSAAPVVLGLLEDLRSAVREVSDDSPGGRLPVPLLLALDEVANLSPIPSLDAIVSEGGGRGLVTLAATQDLGQIRHRWGEQLADAFLTIYGCKVLLRGVADARLLDHLATVVGAKEAAAQQQAQAQGVTGGPHVAAGARLPAHELSELKSGTAWVLVGGEAPRVVTLSLWWRTEPFKSWVARLSPFTLGPAAEKGSELPIIEEMSSPGLDDGAGIEPALDGNVEPDEASTGTDDDGWWDAVDEDEGAYNVGGVSAASQAPADDEGLGDDADMPGDQTVEEPPGVEVDRQVQLALPWDEPDGVGTGDLVVPGPVGGDGEPVVKLVGLPDEPLAMVCDEAIDIGATLGNDLVLAMPAPRLPVPLSSCRDPRPTLDLSRVNALGVEDDTMAPTKATSIGSTAPTTAPDTPAARTGRPNRHAGTCSACGEGVPAGAGVLLGRGAKGWDVAHRVCRAAA